MNKVMSKIVCALAALLLCAGAETTARLQTRGKTQGAADLRIRQRMTANGQTALESVVLIKGARMRSETGGPGAGLATITQCDLRRAVTVNDRARTYMVSAFGATPAGAAEGAASARPAAARRGGVVSVTRTLTDTGERKEMFGYTARRIKTSVVTEASPDSCNPGTTRVESDGWYIDFDFNLNCGVLPTAQPAPAHGGCEDEVRTRTAGAAKLGYPVQVATTVFGKDGGAYVSAQEVLEISRAPLDAALFDVPAGYAPARDAQALYGAAVVAAEASRASGGNGGGGGGGASTSPAAGGMTSAGAPKRPGVIRIGLVTPKAQLTSGDAARAAEAVRNSLADYLRGPSIEVVNLEARLPQQALEEARQGQCDFVLHAALAQKKGGGGGGLFGKALGSIAGATAGYIPGGGNAGEAAVRSAAVTGVYTTAGLASQVKAKDELSLEYRLESVADARAVVSRAEKAKAKADGEDVLTPLVERAAAAVVAAARK